MIKKVKYPKLKKQEKEIQAYLPKRSYTGRLKIIRRYAKEINGALYVPRLKVKEVLKRKEFVVFEQKHIPMKMHPKCECGCPNAHYDLTKQKRYYYFWDLEKLLSEEGRFDK